jgi:hypothetical protein
MIGAKMPCLIRWLVMFRLLSLRHDRKTLSATKHGSARSVELTKHDDAHLVGDASLLNLIEKLFEETTRNPKESEYFESHVVE